MKFSFIVIFILSLPAFGSNWMPVSKIQAQAVQAYQLEQECKKLNEQCLDVGDEPQMVNSGFVSLENDWGPETEVDECSDEVDCTSKLEIKSCSDGQSFIDAEFSKVYCSKFLGKKLVKDNAGWSAYKAGELQKAYVEALIANGAKARGDCQRVLDLIGGFNLLPGRTTEQAGQMVSTFAEAKQALQDGRPTAAKNAIQAIPVDGVLVSQSMKDLALDILKDW